MTLELKNIGMIKEASVKIDGLIVIAGENDTGKSTLGKSLFSLIKSDNIAWIQKATEQRAKEILATRLNLVFDGNVTKNGSIKLVDKSKKQNIVSSFIKDNNYVEEFTRGSKNPKKFFDATIIQSPLVFDLVGFFDSVAKMRERQRFDYGLDFDVSYPYVLWDLYDKLSKENPFPRVKIQEKMHDNIQEIIGGEFKLENGKFYYYKYLDRKVFKIEMLNTAYGIKSFALLQLLNKNKFLNQKNCLIIDEPEVHLHPKWQLKFAEIIVFLVKNKLKVVVNSHSPYMIEALKRYSDLAKIEEKTNFYLAEDGYIKQIDNSNSQTLVAIYEKLSEPYDIFEEMESKRFQNG